MKNSEPLIPLPQLRKDLAELETAIAAGDRAEIDVVLKRTVEGYSAQPNVSPPALGELDESGEWLPASRTLH